MPDQDELVNAMLRIVELEQREQAHLSELADYALTVQRLNRELKAHERGYMTSAHVAAAVADICEFVHESCTGPVAYLIRERIKDCVQAELADRTGETGDHQAQRPKL